MATPEQSPRLKRAIAITLLALITLFGLAAVVTWLSVKPRRLNYTIEDGQVHDFNLHDNHLNASFDFIFRAYNPNHRLSLYYDSIVVSVSYKDDQQTVAFDVVEPFYQPQLNVTRFKARPVARAVPLVGSVSRDLTMEKSSGEVKLAVRVKARIRFKLGEWRSSHHVLRVLCFPTVVHLNSSKAIERTDCDVDY